ncbi:MAG TPA: phosphotransferase [Planctomycetota bacterium]|nr:phosphotransferase [Planctomycetota bacterium]
MNGPDSRLEAICRSLREWRGGGRAGTPCRFSCVRNSDGTVRWFFRSDTSHPAFLALYNATTLRGRLYAQAVRWLFRRGLGRLAVPETFEADFSDIDLLNPWLDAPERFEHVAFFTGTRGQDEKVVAALGRGGRVTHFLKIPLGIRARELVRAEAVALDRARVLLPSRFEVPRAPEGVHSSGALLLTSVRPEEGGAARLEDGTLVDFLSALVEGSARRQALGASSFYRAVAERVEALSEVPEGLGGWAAARLAVRLREAFRSLPVDREVSFAFAHGDFTPWNLHAQGDRLGVYDWELAGEAPVLHDLFHFVCQSGVLIRRRSARAILRDVGAMEEKDGVRDLARRFGVDLGLHFRLYLVDRASYYLRAYLGRADLHPQAAWLMEFWGAALEDMEEQGPARAGRRAA